MPARRLLAPPLPLLLVLAGLVMLTAARPLPAGAADAGHASDGARSRLGRVKVKPSPVDFGKQPNGTVATKRVAFLNTGDRPLAVWWDTLLPPYYSQTVPMHAPIILDPHGSYAVDVLFKVDEAQPPYPDRGWNIYDDAHPFFQTIKLKGRPAEAASALGLRVGGAGDPQPVAVANFPPVEYSNPGPDGSQWTELALDLQIVNSSTSESMEVNWKRPTDPRFETEPVPGTTLTISPGSDVPVRLFFVMRSSADISRDPVHPFQADLNVIGKLGSTRLTARAVLTAFGGAPPPEKVLKVIGDGDQPILRFSADHTEANFYVRNTHPTLSYLVKWSAAGIPNPPWTLHQPGNGPYFSCPPQLATYAGDVQYTPSPVQPDRSKNLLLKGVVDIGVVPSDNGFAPAGVISFQPPGGGLVTRFPDGSFAYIDVPKEHSVTQTFQIINEASVSVDFKLHLVNPPNLNIQTDPALDTLVTQNPGDGEARTVTVTYSQNVSTTPGEYPITLNLDADVAQGQPEVPLAQVNLFPTALPPLPDFSGSWNYSHTNIAAFTIAGKPVNGYQGTWTNRNGGEGFTFTTGPEQISQIDPGGASSEGMGTGFYTLYGGGVTTPQPAKVSLEYLPASANSPAYLIVTVTFDPPIPNRPTGFVEVFSR